MYRSFKKAAPLVVSLLVALFSIGCSVKQVALKGVAGALTGEGPNSFASDNDPQLIADALPFALKTYESLLASLPRDVKLNYVTGKTFVMYSYAFIQSPADTISDERIELKTAQQMRAKKMYIRGRDYIMTALELKHKGFKRLMSENKVDSALALTNKNDTNELYWGGMAWMAAFTADKFDLSLLVDVPKPVAMINRVHALNPNYGRGTLYDFYISFYGAMPKSMGGDKVKARECFNKSLELSKGSRVSPYISLATAIAIPEQNLTEFKELMESALSVNVEAFPENLLVNTLSQDKARWYLDHTADFFVDATESDPELSDPVSESPLEKNPTTTVDTVSQEKKP